MNEGYTVVSLSIEQSYHPMIDQSDDDDDWDKHLSIYLSIYLSIDHTAWKEGDTKVIY